MAKQKKIARQLPVQLSEEERALLKAKAESMGVKTLTTIIRIRLNFGELRKEFPRISKS